jgi:hypothetical protein
MPDFDWRSPETYLKIQHADVAGVAWECVRRNPDYEQQYRILANPLASVPSAFRQKWGLTFRS